VGLPEAHVSGIVLRNVKIHAQRGLSIGYAEVATDGLEVHVEEGAPLLNLTGANVTR
jgi:hypothetical protein